jgi:X-Pro dipeptidyl-peptidase
MPRRATTVAVVSAAAALLAAAPAAAQQPPPWLELENGVTKAQFDFAQAIEQAVFVETELDTDFDGKRDLVRIQVSRPQETETEGIKVPVVFEHSPYRSPDPGSLANHNVDFDRMPQESLGTKKTKRRNAARAAAARSKPDFPDNRLDNHYVPRGYAVVLGESIGTFNSTGCPDVGARAETLGTKAVIDWLNGRARGWTDMERSRRVRADWTTGDVGMTGVSYNGTLPNQVATTGVEGLKTIIPVAAISSWYDYYRANGLVVAPHSRANGAGDNAFLGEDTDVLAAYIGGDERMTGTCARVMDQLVRRQDRVTGDWSSFWSARDYLSRAKRVRASVFVVHGLNDWNVRTKAFAEWWYRLARHDVPRKIWLHTAGHGTPGRLVEDVPDAERVAYLRAEHRWFDRWLFGVPNRIESEPRSSIEGQDGVYRQEADWPLPGTRRVKLQLSSSSATAPGDLTAGRRSNHSRKQSFVDRGRELDTDDVLIQSPDAASPNRLVYRTQPLARAVRISGTPFVKLRMSIDNRSAANLTAVVVDYGGAAPVMVTRGWLDPQNRTSISRSKRIKRGHLYRFRWDLQPDDYVFAAGHRIGLVVVSTDHDYTIRPSPGTRLTLDPAGSELSLPIAGGAL